MKFSTDDSSLESQDKSFYVMLTSIELLSSTTVIYAEKTTNEDTNFCFSYMFSYCPHPLSIFRAEYHEAPQFSL